jgi:hypothetical protein
VLGEPEFPGGYANTRAFQPVTGKPFCWQRESTELSHEIFHLGFQLVNISHKGHEFLLAAIQLFAHGLENAFSRLIRQPVVAKDSNQVRQ